MACGRSVLLHMMHVHCCVPSLYVMLLWRHAVSSFGTPVCIVRALFFLALVVRLLSSRSMFSRGIGKISVLAFVWDPGVGNCSFCSDALCCSGFVGSCFLPIAVLVVYVLSFLCGSRIVAHTSCIRVLALGCLLCVLACVWLWCIAASCLPMCRVLAILLHAFVGHVGIFRVILLIFSIISPFSIPCG